ncbi:MAG: right-handed parallel beta-helix repeat-containing protein, partial [Bacteroidetes bacterium]|nr:right-handed parallel beta-helix repeat-containing protein [Bacteroidota bacterium]
MKKSITILVLSLLCGWARSQFPGGTGTPSDPYQVITPADLNYVRNFSGNSYSGTYFKLMNDIDLTSYLASGGDGYTLWGGAGWEPIGTFTDKFFGQFDGNNHNIGGLKINRGDSYIGLFGCVGNGGSIHNIGVEIDPAGAVTGYQYVGGLAGLNYGSISYCHTTGAVTGTSMLDGGLVGQNDGCITNCYATGAVTGSWSVGGLVGFNHGGTISNSYARGAVSGDQPGGLVGQNGSPIIGGTIINSYATGLVSGAYSGGLAGQYESNGTVTNSYWDTETTGQPTSAGGTGESTAGMKLQLTFTGWDFTAPVWIMNSGINNGYPYLSPPVQASAIVFSAVLSAGMTIGWTNGNETKRVVFIKHANTGTAIPANNTNYTADPNFGSGTQIGSTGWYCVYNSTGTSVAVTGLTAKTDYIVEVFEYIDPCGAKYNTSTATDNPKSQTTAAIEVTATAGTFGPTGYATLKAAFDAVNLGTHQDIITIKINSSTTETASAALNASGSGSAVYSAVIIYPTVTGLSISGAIDGPLVDLNGADYVTIDGRVGGTGSAKDLVIMNTSTSSATGNSTIRFISDASNNIVRYCTLKGSTLQGNSGVVCFQNNVGTNGNDLNTIEYNNITSSSDGARPTAAIASVLLTGSTAISDNNTISNNMIYDFLQPESNFSRGLNISQGASDWTITGNSFYETTSYSPTQNNPNYIIYVNSGANHTISSNSIGGSSPLCSGTWTKTASANNPFYGTGLTGSPYDAIKIANGVSNVTIDGFEIRNYAGSGSNGDGNAISSYCMSSNTTGASNVTIKNNYIHNLAYNGILAGSENDNGSTMVVQSGWLIQYNKLANFTYAGIELTNVINSQVYDNTIAAPTSLFSDPGDAGVGIEIAARSRLKAVTAGTNEVSRNTITGTFPVGSRAAINLLSRAYDDASANATLSNITVSGNSISGATNVRAAVLAVAESRSSHPSTISTLSITDNTLDGNLDELEIQDYINGGTGPATHSGITITGNDIKNSTGVGLHVMVSTTATGISATNNKIVSNALFGIKNEGSGTFAATSNYWGGCPKPKISGAATYYPYYTTCTGTAGSLVLGGLINNIVASASASPVCAGSSTTIYATGGSDYVWDNGLGSGATKVVTPTVNPTTYSVTATDAYGCTGAFASVSIAITPAPTVIITPSLDHTTLTASGATTYLWSTGATTAAITVSPSVFATYTVTGTTGTCTGTTSYTVAVANAGSNQYICNGSSANLNATLTGATATAYAWTPVTGLSNPAIQNPVASPTVTTTYTVSITATNGPYS